MTAIGRWLLATPCRVDRWIFADGDLDRLLLVRRLLAVLMTVRVLTWRYHDYAELPQSLVHPVWYWSWSSTMPPVGVMLVIQVIGVAAGVAVLMGRRANQAFVVLWCCFVALAGLRAGLGKVLHNDALPILAIIPFLWPIADRAVQRGSGAPQDEPAGQTAGWQIRSAQLVVATIYTLTGVQKLRHSGPDWFLTDNMAWIMSSVSGDGGGLSAIPTAIAREPLLWRPAGYALLFAELLFPLVFLNRWTRAVLVTCVVALHLITLVTLRLDYLSWVWVVLVLFVDWRAVRARPSSHRSPGSRLARSAALG